MIDTEAAEQLVQTTEASREFKAQVHASRDHYRHQSRE